MRTITQALFATFLMAPSLLALGSPETLAQQKAAFIQNTATTFHLSKPALSKILAQAKELPSVLKKIKTPYEAKPFDIYTKHFLTKKRIDEGNAYWNAHQKALTYAQKKYGVEPSVIVAILGVETLYGEVKGSYSVLNALYTLSFFYPSRAPFFTHELAEYFAMCHQQGLSPFTIKGSYAGAFGMPQFMPSSYRAYGVDYSQNHHVNLMTNDNDVIMSVANFLAKAGWQPNTPIAAHLHNQKTGSSNVITLKNKHSNEYWIAYPNLKSIMHYNSSVNYAMTVYKLSKAIRKKHDKQLS